MGFQESFDDSVLLVLHPNQIIARVRKAFPCASSWHKSNIRFVAPNLLNCWLASSRWSICASCPARRNYFPTSLAAFRCKKHRL